MKFFFSATLLGYYLLAGLTSYGQPGPDRAIIGVSRDKDHYCFLIPENALDQPMMVINRVEKANAESGYYADDLAGQTRMIAFRKIAGNKIGVSLLNFAAGFVDTSSSLFAAVSGSNITPVLTSFDIKGKKGNAYLIDVQDFLSNATPVFGASSTSLDTVQVGEQAISMLAWRQLTPPQSRSQQPNGDAAQGGLMPVRTVFLQMSRRPMKGRMSDARVGYASNSYMDFGTYNKPIREVSLIRRWRLEPKEEDRAAYMQGKLVDPVHPVIFYIDPATPEKWIPYMMQAVNDWQPAFEAAGFSHAIMAARAPQGDSSWSIHNCPAAIIYRVSRGSNSMRDQQLVTDPRSGEILQCHITWDHNVLGSLHDNYMVSANAADAKAASIHFDDAVMGKLIRHAVAAEVGKALGLDGENVSKNVTVGEYEKWAIDWGYRVLPASPDGVSERKYLKDRIRQRSSSITLWWGSGEMSTPPEDPLTAGERGIERLKSTVANLPAWTTGAEGNENETSTVYASILGTGPTGEAAGQFSMYMLDVARVVGGAYRAESAKAGQTSSISFVDAARQRNAVAFLNRQLFSTPHWLVNREIFTRSGDNPLTLIGTLQNNILTLLLGKCLQNLYWQESILGSGRGYTGYQLIHDLQTGIWSELAAGQSIDIYRRKLQNTYLSVLITNLKSGDNSDLQGIALQHLEELQQQAKKALALTRDASSQAHLRSVISRIGTTLKL